ncbi:MAG: hypothetical protein E6Z55_05975 [Peptoniphilus harei]|nr:hypothetical protein [Peptoniphilus harei]
MTNYGWGRYKLDTDVSHKYSAGEPFIPLSVRHYVGTDYEIKIPEVYSRYKISNGQIVLTGNKLYPGYFEEKDNVQESEDSIVSRARTEFSKFAEASKWGYFFDPYQIGKKKTYVLQDSRDDFFLYGTPSDSNNYMSHAATKISITVKKGARLDTVTSSNRNTYPDNGVKDNYWYVYEGIANQEPTISGQDEDWGGYKQAFKRYYSVDDGDSGQQLNVVVTLNGVTIATVNNATRKSDYPIDIDDSKFNALTLNEQNTIEITVTDSSGATAVRRYTFKRINTAPVVTMTNAHYGEQNKPFTINFEAADPDGDEITAKLYIDDVQIKDLGTIKGKQSVIIPKIDFAKIPNGEHKIRVEAKDSYNAVGAGYADFSKNLTYAWYRLKKELSEQPSAVIVNPLSELASGAKMTIKVCSNVMDAQPTWETVPEELYGQKYNFRNTTKTGDKWGVGVEIRIDKEKATEESYLYGFVGAYM